MHTLGGLLGSQKVAAHYHRKKTAVKGVLQVDMTGYVPEVSATL